VCEELEEAFHHSYSNWQKYPTARASGETSSLSADEHVAAAVIHYFISDSAGRAYFSTVGGRIGLGPRYLKPEETVYCI
jgi:hypothetical protein